MLDHWARLNIEMDYRAKRHMEIAKKTTRHYMVALEPWMLWINGRKLISDVAMTLYDLVHSKTAKAYWMNKDNIGMEVVDSVNWNASTRP